MIEELNGDFLQWLRGFYYVAQTGSVRKAAEIMRRNPSTISYQLKSLEDELGTILFDRFKKTLRITSEGKKLLDWTISTFETLQGMRASVGSAEGKLRGQVKIGATLPILALAVNTFGDFILKNPNVRINITRSLSREVKNAVIDAEVDFGLLPVISKPERMCFQVVFKARPLLIVNRENQWNVPVVPDLEDLKKLPYVSFLNKNVMDDLGNYITLMGIGDFVQKNSVIEINNYHLILRFVMQKLGAAIMDEVCFLASQYGAAWDSLMAIPLDHILPNCLYGILQRQNNRQSPQAKSLMDYMFKFYSSLSSMSLKEIWNKMNQDNKPKKN